MRQKEGNSVITRVYYGLTFKSRIKSHLPFEGIIRSSPYSPRLQVKG